MKRRKNPALPEPAARLLAQDRERIEAEEAARASSCAVSEARKAAAAAARSCRAAGRKRAAERVRARRAQIREEWPRKREKRAAGRARLSKAQLAQRSRAGLRTSEEREQLISDAAGYLDEPGDRAAFEWWARREVSTQPGWTAEKFQQLAERFNEERDIKVQAWTDRLEGEPDPEWEAGVLWEIGRDLEDVHPEELSDILAGYQVGDAPDLRRALEALGVDVAKELRKAKMAAKKATRRQNPGAPRRRKRSALARAAAATKRAAAAASAAVKRAVAPKPPVSRAERTRSAHWKPEDDERVTDRHWEAVDRERADMLATAEALMRLGAKISDYAPVSGEMVCDVAEELHKVTAKLSKLLRRIER